MFSRIVVPLDRSDASEAALPLAAHLAERRGLPLTLVHAVDVPPDLASFMDGKPGVEVQLEIERGCHQYLEETASGIDGPEVETALLHGRPAAALVEYLDGLDRPLVVMSSHGRSGFRRMVLGSVTMRVVQAAPCPVLVVRAGEDGAASKTPGRIRRVLAPLDGSPFAEHALDAVHDLVGDKGVAIRLLRVPEVAAYPTSMYGAASYEAVSAYMDAMEDEAKRYLGGIAARFEGPDSDITWEIRQGVPGVAILEAAKAFEADLIAMASHGRGGFRRVLLGSVAEQVLREADVPVLIVGPHGEDGETAN